MHKVITCSHLPVRKTGPRIPVVSQLSDVQSCNREEPRAQLHDPVPMPRHFSFTSKRFLWGNRRQRWASCHLNLPWLQCGKLRGQPPFPGSSLPQGGNLEGMSFAAPPLHKSSEECKPGEKTMREKEKKNVLKVHDLKTPSVFHQWSLKC